MSKQVLVFLGEGFEEIEALTAVDVLRRGELAVTTVAVQLTKEVVGKHQITVVADKLLAEVDFNQADLLLLPGGSMFLYEHQEFKALVADYALNKPAGKLAAICAAPAVLGVLGLIKNKQVTIYPGLEDFLNGGQLVNSSVVVDGNIITAKGPACSMQFALTVLEQLAGKSRREKVAAELLYLG